MVGSTLRLPTKACRNAWDAFAQARAPDLYWYARRSWAAAQSLLVAPPQGAGGLPGHAATQGVGGRGAPRPGAEFVAARRAGARAAGVRATQQQPRSARKLRGVPLSPRAFLWRPPASLTSGKACAVSCHVMFLMPLPLHVGYAGLCSILC